MSGQRDALYALERAATAHLLAVTPDETARTDGLLLEAVEWAREALKEQHLARRYLSPPEDDVEMHGVPGAWAIPVFAILFGLLCVAWVLLR